MNARLDAIPLATARLEREKVELAIERSKLVSSLKQTREG